jgi:hypothetical protein
MACAMTRESSEIDTLAANIAAAIARPASPVANKESYSPRGAFFELLVMALANLYAKVPLGTALFDRATLKAVIGALDDTEAGRLQNRTEDWIRLEGLVRSLEGQKSYTLNRPSLAVLSTVTAHGRVGEIMERLHQRYLQQPASPELRALTRDLASYFLSRLGRG